MRITLVHLTLLLSGPFASPALAEPLAVQVNRAIEKGVERVRTWQRDDGSFNTKYQKSYPVGNTALHLYTLVKSGVPAEDRQVQAALEYLRYKPLGKTYGAAALIMALDALKDRAHDPWIFSAARWLEEKFGEKAGLWAYPTSHHDLSNTQYGVLGLWVAERHGFETSTDIWGRLLQSLCTGYQKEDGGFAYRRDRTQTGSMTASGITILTLALDRVPKDALKYRVARRKAKKALERAWEYLDRRFSVEANPLGSFALTHDAFYYYLFGVERVAAIADRTRIGGRDWYVEGARRLVATQEAKGTWSNSSRATCFALLFLRRATATTMEREAGPVEGEGVAEKSPGPGKPAVEAPYIRRWLLLGPIEDSDDGGLYRETVPEAKVAPRAGARAGDQRWRVYRSLSTVVDLDKALGPGEKRLAYAFTYLHAARDMDAILWIGHDDDCRVFLDGRLRHDHHFHTRRGRDSVAIPLKLTEGTHRLLLKVGNYSGAHNFSVRVGGADGKLAPGLLPSLRADGADIAETALAQPEFFTMEELLLRLPLDRRTSLPLEKEADAHRLAFFRLYPHNQVWFPGTPEEKPRAGPLPGFTGAVRLHPWGKTWPARALRRMRLPTNATRLRVRVCADAYMKHRGRVADGRLRLGVFDGELHWIADRIVGPHAEPSPDLWVNVEGDLTPFAGKEVLLVIECAAGGRTKWWVEGLHLDEINVLLN